MAIANTDGNIVIGTSVDTAGINEGMAKIKSQMSSLGKIAVFGAIGKQLIGLGKSATTAASDLAEVNNVVFTGFGGKEGYEMVNKFCLNCVEKFGLTEYAAKNMAGAFANMGTALGLQQKNANNMAINLTALAGDMASFYNISEDYARVALSAVYTGETETLKRYGIVLTEANLQQFALQQGLTANYRTLDSASKAYVRYMYVMNATRNIQGDFQQTNMSYANSLRILKQEWNNLMIAMGGFIKTVAAPIIQGLTAIVRAFINAFTVLYNTLHKLFGFTIDWGDDYNKTIKDAATNTGDLGSGIGDVGSGATKASKKVKQLNKQLQGFDKLNNLTTTETGGTGGTKGKKGSGSGVGGIDIPDIPLNMKLDGKKKKLPKFDSMYDLGRWISNGIADSLNKIDWQKIQDKAQKVAFELAELLNGLTNPKMFKALGHTIAQGLNTAIDFAYMFLSTYDFQNLGKAFGDGINTFFKEFNWEKFGKTVGLWAEDMCDFIETTISTIDWGQVFGAIGKFIKGLGVKGVWNLFKLGMLKGFIKGAFQLLLGGAGFGKSFLSGNWLPTLFGKAKIGSKFKKFLKKALFNKTVDKETETATYKGLFPAMGRGFKKLGGWIGKGAGKGAKSIGGGISKLFTKVKWKIKWKKDPTKASEEALEDYIDTIDGYKAPKMKWTDSIKNKFKDLGSFFKNSKLGSGAKTLADKIKSPFQKLAQAISDRKTKKALETTEDQWATFYENMGESSQDFEKKADGPLTKIKNKFKSLGDTIKEKFTDFHKNNGGFVDLSNGAEDASEKIDKVNDSSGKLGDTKGIDKLKGAFDNLKTSVGNALGKVKELMTTDVSTLWSSGAAGKAGVVGASVGAELGGYEIGNRIGSAVSKATGDDEMADLYDQYEGLDGQIKMWVDLVGAIKDDWELNVIPAISGWWDGMGNFFSGLGDDINGAWGNVQKTWGTVSGWFSKNVTGPIGKAFKSLGSHIGKFLRDPWGSIQKVWQSVSGWFNKRVIQPIAKFFGNLGTNIRNIFTSARNNIQRIWQTVSGWFNTHVIKPIQRFFGNLGKHIRTTFSTARTNAQNLWKGVSGWFSKHVTGPIRNAFSTMGKGIQSVFKGIRDTFRNIVNGIIGGMNTLIRGINHIKIKVPKGVPKLGGKSFGFSIPQIPKLAQGAVIPPNKEFLAVLGDQKKGTNIETPLSTMVQAFNTALKQNGGAGNNELMSQMIIAMNQQTELLKTIANKNLSIGDREVFNSVKRSAYDYSMRTGKKAF